MTYERDIRRRKFATGLNLLPGENLHSGANCAHEQRLSLSYNYLAGSLINAMIYRCADSPEG